MTSRISSAPEAEAQQVKVEVIYGANHVPVSVPVGVGAAEVASAAGTQHDIFIDMNLVTRVEFDGDAGNALRRPKVIATTKKVEFKTQARRNG